MGWTSTRNYYNSKKEYVEKEIIERFKNESGEIIDHSIKGNVVYTAFKRKEGYVFGLIFFLSKYQGRYSFRDEDETLGPCAYECPKRILNKLTPLDDLMNIHGFTGHELMYMNDWREGNKKRN